MGATPLKEQSGDPAPPGADAAPIAYLYDVTSGQVLFEREAGRRFMPASITKVMTSFLAFEWLEEGRIAPQQSFTPPDDLWRKWKNVGSTMFLAANEPVTVDELIHGVTTVSANDGAALLAHGSAGSVEEWVAAMNAKAAEIGMRDSHFGTPNGWMDEGRTFVTARDLGTLATAMLRRHPAKYRHFVGKPSFSYNGISQPNHDPISGVVRGADGIKTGFTNQAGYGFLGSAYRDGRRLVLVVAGSPRSRVRDQAARDLLEWGFAEFDQTALFGAGAQVAKARVQGGSQGSVGLVAPDGVFIDLPKGDPRKVEVRLQYEGPLRAPITKGELVARFLVSIEGMPDYEVPLVAEEDVDTANAFERAINGLRSWVS
ncbi:D-alanyl-D-alanine carboxypeptidase family protein [Qipengyuania gelatinilytica]|uniref:serine-type D-Ala-D-Ala carboxypeptidase n=1 Tax=Qipengyuania gelatinilytica TaxID=2867231 RepID=A0ABX9A591_9SPHN|nr:D-alanyl-D-alanine carboxypeptidase family protein [Qipengyuania gelatinilytica]QZD96456.1 D-alanyl-D-alanine carboxypeptidase [Qipengyuania gelatinilytica]